MIDRDVLALLERDAVELVRGEEDAVLEDSLEVEVRPDLRLVEVVLGLAHFLGVKIPVGGAEREPALARVDQLLHVGRFAARLFGRGGHEIGQELLRVLGVRAIWSSRT